MAGDAQANSCSTYGDDPCGAMPAHDEPTNESGCISAVRLAVAPREHGQARENEAIAARARGIGHDLNNLLAIITTYTRLVLEELEADDPSRADLEEVCGAAERACLLARRLAMLDQQSDSVVSTI